jgi:hypothetical protein
MKPKNKWLIWQKGEIRTGVKRNTDIPAVINMYADFKPKKIIMVKKVL